jgi:hypothetical protein
VTLLNRRDPKGKDVELTTEEHFLYALLDAKDKLQEAFRRYSELLEYSERDERLVSLWARVGAPNIALKNTRSGLDEAPKCPIESPQMRMGAVLLGRMALWARQSSVRGVQLGTMYYPDYE